MTIIMKICRLLLIGLIYNLSIANSLLCHNFIFKIRKTSPISQRIESQNKIYIASNCCHNQPCGGGGSIEAGSEIFENILLTGKLSDNNQFTGSLEYLTPTTRSTIPISVQLKNRKGESNLVVDNSLFYININESQ